MCGIVGYVGQRNARDVVVDALRRMEYRGYDSSGMAVLDGTGGMTVRRRAGRLANLEEALALTDPLDLQGGTGIGHTRWATHGRPTDRNAHPHRDASGRFAVVHNGIIENFAALRAELEADGVEFASDTDSEVAVHLVARAFRDGPTAGDFVGSVLAVLRRLEWTVLRRLDGLLQGNHLGLVPGPGTEPGDARAYAAWAGKRLPTEDEWQFAAQGREGFLYPWGNEMRPNRCNGGETGGTTPVTAFPEGLSPFGCYDFCGNTWEWTESEHRDGRTRFAILKGGSYYAAKGSDWYFDGGPQTNRFAAKFLLHWPGLDRCATIGFRCVKDMV